MRRLSWPLLGALVAAAAPREAWDDLSWLGGGFAGAACGGERWLVAYNDTQNRMLDGRLAPRFVVVRPHGRAGLGNRLRAVRAGLAIAALSGRALVLDYGRIPGRPATDSLANRTELSYLAPGLVRWDGAARLYETAREKRGPAFASTTLPNNARGLDAAALPKSTVGALVVDGWNHDPTARIRAAAGAAAAAAGLGPEVSDARYGSCALRALFRPTPRLVAELDGARSDLGGAALDAAIHLRTNIEFANDWGDGNCRDVTCWSRVAAAFAACARAAGGDRAGTRTLLVAADDRSLVDAVLRAEGGARFTAVALPAHHRHHSGMSRPLWGLKAETAERRAFGHGDVLGPLLDLLLLASATVFVGTSGSSFSEQALAWGAYAGAADDASAPSRAAVVFKTPFVKSGQSGAGAVYGPKVPATPAAATALCAAPLVKFDP